MAVKVKPIIVIGAGAAGLSATSELIKAGLPVRLLEADHWYGGRVKTVDMGLAKPLDTGAAFLHSKSLNLYAYARAHQLLQKRYPARCLIGNRCMPMWMFGLRYGVPNMRRMSRMLNQFYKLDQATATLDDLLNRAQFSNEFAAVLRSTLSSSLAVGLQQVGVVSLRESFKKAGIRPERDIGQYALKQSLHGLLSHLYSDAIDVCEFNQLVSSIDYSDEPIARIHDNEPVLASHIILTLPLAVLKAQTLQFQPPLPESKQQAIAALGMGQGARIFFRLDRTYWPVGTRQIINSQLPLHITVHSDEPAIISAFYISPDGTAVVDSELYDGCIKMFSQHLGINAADNIIDSHMENWSSNALIGGVYSFDAPDSVGARSELARPLSDKLFFAGEATVEGHFATVDGAILSGQRAAHEIISVYKPET